MSNNILNEELSQMKYLFGYKAGKVISEQVKPQEPGKQTPAPGFKLSGITKDNVQKFIEVSEDFLKSIGAFNQEDPAEVNKLRVAFREQAKQRQAQGQPPGEPTELNSYKNELELLNLINTEMIKMALLTAAQQGLTPEMIAGMSDADIITRLKPSWMASKVWPSVQELGGSWLQPFADGKRDWVALYNKYYPDGDFINIWKNALTTKLKELGIQP